MRKLIIAVLVLVVLAVLADRGGAYAVEHTVSQQLATKYDIDPAPSVEVRGFPFLTQAFGGDYHQVDISMKSVSRGGITLHDVHAHVFDVRAPLSDLLARDTSSITADRAQTTATVPYGVVERRAPHGMKITPTGDHLRLSGSVPIEGFRVHASAVVALSVEHGGIVAKPKNISIGGGHFPASMLENALVFHVPMHQLPLSLHLTGVRVRKGGITISAAGRDIPLSGSGTGALPAGARR